MQKLGKTIIDFLHNPVMQEVFRLEEASFSALATNVANRGFAPIVFKHRVMKKL